MATPSTAPNINLEASADVAMLILEKHGEKCVEKADGHILNGADDLFIITGGPIYGKIVGIFATGSDATVGNGTLQITTVTPAATLALSTAVSVASKVAGTSVRFVGATGVLTPDANGAKIIDPVTVDDCRFLMPVGTVKLLGSAANTVAVIKWYLRYIPLSPDSVVVAAV